jgi:hypothetical protein
MPASGECCVGTALPVAQLLPSEKEMVKQSMKESPVPVVQDNNNLYLILQLSDSAFPTGGFVHSGTFLFHYSFCHAILFLLHSHAKFVAHVTF